MKRSFILLILILVFSILKSQSLYDKYAVPAFKKTNDTTYKPLMKSSVLVTPNVMTGQYFGGQDIQVFPSSTSQSEVHISLNVQTPTELLISANTPYQQGWYYSDNSGNT